MLGCASTVLMSTLKSPMTYLTQKCLMKTDSSDRLGEFGRILEHLRKKINLGQWVLEFSQTQLAFYEPMQGNDYRYGSCSCCSLSNLFFFCLVFQSFSRTQIDVGMCSRLYRTCFSDQNSYFSATFTSQNSILFQLRSKGKLAAVSFVPFWQLEVILTKHFGIPASWTVPSVANKIFPAFTSLWIRAG